MMKITYINHSSFCVEMDDAAFLFDYYKGEIPKICSNKKMYVFSSHAHFDHYNESVFELRDQYSKIYFILSDDIKTSQSENVYRMKPYETFDLDGCKIQTLRSTDEGVAYLLTYKGKTLYHAGDLNWWHWEGEGDDFNLPMGEQYRREIESIEGMKIDVAFVPTDVRQEKEYFWGLDYFMRHTQTNRVFPMHFWGETGVFDQLENQEEVREYREKIMHNDKNGQVFELEV